MSCTKCGCRMVTKVGSSNTLLICSDCGHPRAEKAGSTQTNRKHVVAVAFLAALVGLTYTISRLSKATTPLAEPVQKTQAE